MADLIKIGVFPAPNQPLEPDIAAKICEIHGFVFEREKRDKDKGFHKVEEVIKEPEAPVEEPEDLLKNRPPIVTIMGHVDHGKTSILDFFRKTKVVAGEAGGITQHIGAYQVIHNDQEITFLDTPGHAIFSDMRARGADITDIVVLVVAANDGIMPQTLEAIKHAKKAKKTIIVAINKCDLPSANVDRVKSQLAENGLQTTDFGGDTEFAEVSALTGKGMDDLLELIALQAEVLELKANPKATARAAVIEARVVPGRGTTATVIVESGTLKVGTPFICGPFAGKVRSLINDRGVAVKSAHPGMPVEVIGFEELPNVGDHLTEMKTEREAKALAARTPGSPTPHPPQAAAPQPHGGPLLDGPRRRRQGPAQAHPQVRRARLRRGDQEGRARHRVRQGRVPRSSPPPPARSPSPTSPTPPPPTPSSSASTSRSKPRP